MMSGLPLFPQSALPVASGATGAALPSLSGEQGSPISFDALLNQSAQVSGETATATALVPVAPQPSSPATSGSFEDLGVILQLLRASTASSDEAPAGAATLPSQMIATLDEPIIEMATPDSLATPDDSNTAPSPALQVLPQIQTALPPHLGPMVPHAAGKQTEKNNTPGPAPQLAEALTDTLAKPALTTPVPVPALPGAPAPMDAAQASALAAAPAAADAQQTPVIPQVISAALAPVEEKGTQQAPQLAAANAISAQTPRKSPAPASPPMAAAAAPTGTDAAPAPAFARMAAALAANTAMAAPPPAPTATAMSVDGGAAMAIVFQSAAATTATATPLDTTSSAATVREQILDLSSDDAWIDQLAKDIAATRSGTGDISFRLMPRHLGRLDVAMTQNDHGISVRLDAQTETAASIVAAAQTRLVDELRQQGVRVASAEVTCSPQDAGRQSPGRDGQSRDGQGQQPAGNHFIETAPDRLPDAGRSDKGTSDPRGRFA